MKKRICGSVNPNDYQILRNDARLSASRRRLQRDEKIYIDVQFVHITSGNRGRVTKEARNSQVAVLNRAYSLYGIEFGYRELEVKIVENSFWYGMEIGSPAEKEAKRFLHGSPERHLNFYTAGLGARLLGWATYPWELEGNRDLDGVVVLDETLPGGSEYPYNLGMTAVHEVGHWLGLYHTFQGGCDGIGDHVGDTPAHADYNEGIPDDSLPNGACENGELAPVHNYMNYCDDEWMSEFTDEQISRVKRHVAEYRPKFIVTA